MVAQKRKAAAKTESRIAFSADATQRSSSSTQMTTSFLSVPQPAIDPNSYFKRHTSTRCFLAREGHCCVALAIPATDAKQQQHSPSKTMVTQHNKKARAKAMSKRKRKNRQVLRSADETEEEEEEEGQNNARLTFGATDPNCVSTSLTPHAPLGCSVSSTTTTSKTHAQHRPPPKKKQKKEKARPSAVAVCPRARVESCDSWAPSVPR